MGGSQSSQPENKVVESSGQVNNNVVVAFDTLQNTVADYGLEIVLLLLILCILKILEFASYVYVNHTKKMKKKYGNGGVGQAQAIMA